MSKVKFRILEVHREDGTVSFWPEYSDSWALFPFIRIWKGFRAHANADADFYRTYDNAVGAIEKKRIEIASKTVKEVKTHIIGD